MDSKPLHLSLSFYIGDTAEFLYGDERDIHKAKKVLLESGDVLIYGDKSRNIFHGITAIRPYTSLSRLVEETNLCKPGRWNLTFNQLIPFRGQGPQFNHHPLTQPTLLIPLNATRWISWYPSKENCFVLNVDGSCLGDSGRAGAGGLIRRGDGSWVIGFSCFLGIANSTYTELMAVYHGLNLAMNISCTYICCYSDSKAVIDVISKPMDKFNLYASVIANIKELMILDWEVNLSHTLREGNASADFLAKLGSNNDNKMMIWNSPPEDLKSLLLSDSTRVLHPRP